MRSSKRVEAGSLSWQSGTKKEKGCQDLLLTPSYSLLLTPSNSNGCFWCMSRGMRSCAQALIRVVGSAWDGMLRVTITCSCTQALLQPQLLKTGSDCKGKGPQNVHINKCKGPITSGMVSQRAQLQVQGYKGLQRMTGSLRLCLVGCWWCIAYIITKSYNHKWTHVWPSHVLYAMSTYSSEVGNVRLEMYRGWKCESID